MSDDHKPKPRDTALGRILYLAVACLFLVVLTICAGFAGTTTEPVLLPIEILGANGTTASRSVTLRAELAESVQSLWLQVYGLQYAEQGSVQVNSSAWIPLKNNTVTIAEPGKSFGGIGGGFATLVMSLPLPKGTVVDGPNTIRFRFNQTDGLASGYRVLAWNFLTKEGRKILPPDVFVEDAPESWTAPLPDAASIRVGRELWLTASLTASNLPRSPRIQARCADCHAQDGRDLKYFNFSNASIVARSTFHGLSTLQGEQIASYIRSLPLPNPGRPWNPPYQPGPGLNEQAMSNWAAGAGLGWVLERDTDALPYLLGQSGTSLEKPALDPSGNALSFRELARKITPDIFRPDGNLNPREIPIALQLPDWSRWLPRIHPKDAWGADFTQSDFAAWYGGDTTPAGNREIGAKPSLRALLTAAQNNGSDIRPVVGAFGQWSKSRHAFLRRFVKAKTEWSPELTNKVYSTQLWQLIKTWEMMQEFALEGRGRDLLGSPADPRTWCNTVPAETSPSAVHIPDGPAGVGGSALTNQYFTASWYELQIVLNSGSHERRDRAPLDWVYVIGRFLDLYGQTHQPEPTRLLVAVTKALQSSDPHLGPDDVSRGWRPDQNIDPRIMISPDWAPIFKPLPSEIHQALTGSLLSAWMDKNLQYPIAKYLPVGSSRSAYTPRRTYADISGGNVWDAAPQFRSAGVSAELVERLEEWGIAFTDRAARLQYH
jgi:hypothetical protein